LKEAIGPSQVGQCMCICARQYMCARVRFLFEACQDTGAGMCLPQQDGPPARTMARCGSGGMQQCHVCICMRTYVSL
jgi:hypothetical protein